MACIRNLSPHVNALLTFFERPTDGLKLSEYYPARISLRYRRRHAQRVVCRVSENYPAHVTATLTFFHPLTDTFNTPRKQPCQDNFPLTIF